MPLTQVQSGMMDSVAQYYSFKNRFINGGMGIWQRGSSGSVVSGGLAYTADRTYLYTVGSTISFSQATGLSVGGNISASAILFSGAAGNTAVNTGQRIESVNIKDLAGSAVTFSCWLFSSVAVNPSFYASTPTAVDNYTSVTTIGSLPTFTVPANTWTYVTATFTLPASAVNGLDVAILWGATTSGNRYITGIQLEKGVTATSFDYRPYTTELQLCQRYLPAYNNNGSTVTPIGTASEISGTQATLVLPFKVTARVPPTNISVSSGAAITLHHSGANIATTAITFAAGSVDNGYVVLTAASGLTAGYSGYVYLNSTSAQLLFTGCEL